MPFVVFVIAATAELNRPPFDLVEAEQELVSGFNTEYASFRFALFFLAEFMNTVTMSAIIVTLFLGGPRGLFDIPLINGGLEGTIWFVAKVFVFLYVYVWFRATLPRLALRPADGSRLEAADPGLARRVCCSSRRCASPRTTTGTVASSASPPRHRWSPGSG